MVIRIIILVLLFIVVLSIVVIILVVVLVVVIILLVGLSGNVTLVDSSMHVARHWVPTQRY